MKININKIHITALTALWLFSITGQAAAMGIKNHDISDIITVRRGEKFTVTLNSNPTTGFSWQFAKEIDAHFLELVDSRYIGTGTGRLMGAGGRQEWVFKAIKPGKTSISLEYARPWERDKSCQEAKDITIIIR